jgi:Uma2 family endonuclease
MTAVGALMTVEQYDALPLEEGRKWELLDGELIEVPSATPRHNRIMIRLSRLLDSFAETRRLGVVLPETDLAVRKDSRLRPDFSFFTSDTWLHVDIDRVPVFETPDVAVEIISRSESAATIQRKVEAYLQWGVREIWLVYPETRTIMLHTAVGAQRFSEGALFASASVPGWELQMGELFNGL